MNRYQAAFQQKFRTRLVRLQREHNMSQEELAERTGLHAVAITYIETDRRTPRIDTVFKITRGLNVTMEEFFRDL